MFERFIYVEKSMLTFF